MLSTNTRTRQLNGTCASSVDMELFLHYSLLPSLFIILVLSFLQRREHCRQRGDTSYLLGNHFGIIIPLDFVGTFSNRWSYGIAFGATANKVMFLFSESYQPLQVPQWAQAFVLLIGGIEVGLSHFPFFACLSSEFRLVSSILGFSYSLIWFAVTLYHITQCPHGQFVGRYEAIVFYWPSLLCLAFLLGRFLHTFVKSLRVRLGWELPMEEKPFLEVHQAEHVKKLLRKLPVQEKKKSWFQTRVYEWDPCFQFPSRMIGTTVLAFICLYLFIAIEFYMFVYVRDELDVFEGELESYLTSVNRTGTLTPVILQVKELMSVAEGVWVVTILPASLTCVSYLFHILACYRKHMKRLWAGDKHFLPLKFHNPSSSESVVAIARYSGWQIAYILWGKCHHVTHSTQHAFPGHLWSPGVGKEERGEAEAAPAPPRGTFRKGEAHTYRSSSPSVLSPQGIYAKGGGDPEREVTIHTQGRAQMLSGELTFELPLLGDERSELKVSKLGGQVAVGRQGLLGHRTIHGHPCQCASFPHILL
ncbi:PREDICTED: uncharacterized protein LOC101396000 [Ceratotherium simum simum]|uniref:Uncharacterized protein LOC101396000 n=1 Tax=Ceratotherium simum simum TaxID=73337 RepID=A0ABM1CCU9_CERSS|nr:PREDICTED: uncharacterized protein LOC101396000 [Ceratotherium simum simum]